MKDRLLKNSLLVTVVTKSYYIINITITNLVFSFYCCRVHETDSSFFESFTALAWKQENRRLIALQEMEERTTALGDDLPSEYGMINLPHLTEIRLHKKEVSSVH